MFSTMFAVLYRTARIALPVFIFVVHAFAQTTVEGVVSNPIASPVPNAALDLQREDGKTVQRATTDANGRFHFFADGGAYLLTTHAEGFHASKYYFVLRAREPLTLAIELQAKQSTQETVEVRANYLTIDPEKTGSSYTFTQQDLELLPDPLVE